MVKLGESLAINFRKQILSIHQWAALPNKNVWAMRFIARFYELVRVIMGGE